MSFAIDHMARGSRRIVHRPEQELQIRIISFCAYSMTFNGRSITEWLYHCPNGGKRNATEAGILKAMGVRPGVNDLILPISCGGFGGLYIELKATEKQGLTDSQIDFHQRLREGGQKVTTCRSLTQTVNAIVDYMRPAGTLFVLRAQPHE